MSKLRSQQYKQIVQMALIVPEFKPHFVIVYHGCNDIRNYHEEDLGADYYGHSIRQFKNLSIAANCTDPLKTMQDVSDLFPIKRPNKALFYQGT